MTSPNAPRSRHTVRWILVAVIHILIFLQLASFCSPWGWSSAGVVIWPTATFPYARLKIRDRA